MSDGTDFSLSEYKRSRSAYKAQCTTEYLITILVSDAFLAKLLTYCGIPDHIIGIISSFISLAFVIQIFSIFIGNVIKNVKRTVVIFDTFSQLLFGALFLVPFMPLKSGAVKTVIMAIILVAYSCQYLIINICFKWANSFVSPDGRATYSAVKEIISLVSGILFTLAVGYIFDKCEASGKTETGFIIISVLIFIISCTNFACLMLISKNSPMPNTSGKSLRQILSHTAGNKSFRPVILFTVFFEAGKYFSLGFLGTFKTKDLAISVLVIQIINMAGNLARIFASRPFGRYSDKRSYSKGMELALLFCMAGYGFIIFTTRTTWYFIIPYTVLNAISLAGTNANSYNITYSYVNAEYISEAMSIKNCIGGIVGFGASLLGGCVLRFVQQNGNRIAGISIYGQQLLAFISIVLVLTAYLINKFVISKNKIIKQ